MKQSQIVGAYTALSKLTAREWPVKIAYQLMLIQDALEPAYRAGIRMQEKLIGQYGGVERYGGVFTFPSIEEQKGFQAALEELMDADVSVTYRPMVMSEEMAEGLKLRPMDMRALIGVVDFNHLTE